MQKVAESKIHAGLIRLASCMPESNPFRGFFAALAKAAGANEDMLVRSSFIEGLLGIKPNTLSRSPRAPFARASEALAKGGPDSDPIAKALTDRGFSLPEALKMVSPMDQGLFQALLKGAQEGMGGKASVRGIEPIDVVMSVLGGISPQTLERYKKYGGTGVMQWIANKHPMIKNLKYLKSIASRNMANHAGDLAKRKQDKTDSLNAPVGQDSTETFLDMLADDAGPSLFSSVLKLEDTLDLIDPIMQGELRNDRQRLVWQAFKANPDVLTYDGTLGVNGPALAKVMADLSGEPYTGRSQDVMARRAFMDIVLPAMMNALQEQDVAKELLRHSEVMSMIQEEMQPRMASTNRAANQKLVQAALKEMLNLS